jgi:geranylgeranyl pyrophosphate synthase
MAIADISLDYIITYNLKEVTGSYTFLFPLRFGHALATGNSAIDPSLEVLATAVGVLFQIGDDIIGLF